MTIYTLPCSLLFSWHVLIEDLSTKSEEGRGECIDSSSFRGHVCKSCMGPWRAAWLQSCLCADQRREDILSLVSRDSLAKRGKDWTVESRVTWTQNSPKKFLCCGGQEIVPPNVQVNEWPSIWTLQRKDRCTFLLNRNRVKPILKLFKISWEIFQRPWSVSREKRCKNFQLYRCGCMPREKLSSILM